MGEGKNTKFIKVENICEQIKSSTKYIYIFLSNYICIDHQRLFGNTIGPLLVFSNFKQRKTIVQFILGAFFPRYLST